MSKKVLFALLGLFCLSLVVIPMFGCAVTSKDLKAAIDTVTKIGSSDATISGTLTYASGAVDIALNPVMVSGDAKTVSTTNTKIRISTDSTAVLTSDAVTFTLPGGTKPVDIVFVQDNTGSMRYSIVGAIDSINRFAASLEAAGIDAKFALVAYGDSALHPTPAGTIEAEGKLYDTSGFWYSHDNTLNSGDPYPRPIQDFTNAATLKGVLSAEVFASGGNDLPENPLDAVMYAYNHFSWRSAAQKVIIVITDAPCHQKIAADTSTYNKCTTSLEAVVTALLGKAVVYTVSPNLTVEPYYGSWSDPGWDIRRLADGLGGGRTTPLSCTGGKWMDFNTSGYDLAALGVSTLLNKSYTIHFSYTFSAGTYYVYIQIDTDNDGVYDSNALIKVTVASASSVRSATAFGAPPVVKAEVVQPVTPYVPRPNKN
jgi:hypothetical protein